MKFTFYFLSLIYLILFFVINGYVIPKSPPKNKKCMKPLYDKAFQNFDDMLAKLELPVLVDFYAVWCGPCVMMQPVLEEIAGRMEKEIKVAKVDTDKSPRLGSRYKIEALPTLVLFNKSEVVDKYVGYMTADELEKEVRKSLDRLKAAGAL